MLSAIDRFAQAITGFAPDAGLARLKAPDTLLERDTLLATGYRKSANQMIATP